MIFQKRNKICFGVIYGIIFALMLVVLYGAYKVIKKKKVNNRQNSAYLNIIDRYFNRLPEIEKKDKLTLAKKINFFTNNFCQNIPPHEPDEKLFENCRTACGGYVYVFGKIADNFNLKTRPVYLYNISNQGNHSLIEVNYKNDKWALFDPTFGSFFTKNGDVNEVPYSLDDMYFYLNKDVLIHNVVKAKKISIANLTKSLKELYSVKVFSEKFMKLVSYLESEQYGYADIRQKTVLNMAIDMKKNHFFFGTKEKDVNNADKYFLQKTNDTLNDTIDNNDISYKMSYIGEGVNSSRVNSYKFTGLNNGSIYSITFYGYNPHKEAAIYPYFLNNGCILQKTGPQPLNEHYFEDNFQFRAKGENCRLMVELYKPEKKQIRLFGIEIKYIN